MTPVRVAVIGGGITGLACAFTLKHEASRRSLSLELTVLEASPEIGGHAQTIAEDGWLVEKGPNGFLDREPETLTMIAELGLESRLVEANPASKRRFIVRNRKLRRVPDSPASLLSSDALGWSAKLRLMAEPFAPGPPAGVDETVYDFAKRRIGAEAAESLVDTAVSGISAGDSRVLSVRAQFPMMVEMERDHGSLVRAMFARRMRGARPGRLRSFDGGMAVLTQELAVRLGESLRVSTRIVSVSRHDEAWRLGLSDGSSVVADRVVLAVSAHAAATVLGSLDEALSFALREIPYSGLSVVGLAFQASDIPRGLEGYGYLVTRAENMATLGVVWESSLFPGRAPANGALMRVFLGGSRRPDVVDLDDRKILALARAELADVMGVTAWPRKLWVFRWPSAIAQYTVGHLERVSAIRRRVAAYDGLSLCGTAYDGVSFNHGIAAARNHARAIAGSLAA
jgi:protoporphyrinogen/coproporphyrinogen III oxidase